MIPVQLAGESLRQAAGCCGAVAGGEQQYRECCEVRRNDASEAVEDDLEHGSGASLLVASDTSVSERRSLREAALGAAACLGHSTYALPVSGRLAARHAVYVKALGLSACFLQAGFEGSTGGSCFAVAVDRALVSFECCD
jgi:hypothetical protein